MWTLRSLTVFHKLFPDQADSPQGAGSYVPSTQARGRGAGRGRGGRGRGRNGEGFGNLFDDQEHFPSRWVREEILAGVGDGVGSGDAAREAEEALQVIAEENDVDLAEAPLFFVSTQI